MKSTHTIRAFGAGVLSAAALLALASSGHAALTYTVTMNVASLVGNTNAPFSLDFQLVPGSDNVTNSVTLSNFQVTGGSLSGTPTYLSGNESGSTASSVVLSLTTPGSDPSDNEFAQAFTAGVTQIKFNVSQTTNSETVTSGTAIPDQFNVAVLDSSLSNIQTNDLSGNNELLSSVIASGETIGSLATFTSTSPDAGVTVFAIVPEPATAVFGLGLLAVAATVRRRKQRVLALVMA